jgi:ubiquinone/menaquinone biosynthesis C-methylase UbiE
VLRPGGVFITLELFRPQGAASRFVHAAGLRYALPVLGAALAKDRDAYAYLAESMDGFVSREAYERLLAEEGFGPVDAIDLTLGMLSIVTAKSHVAPQASARGERIPNDRPSAAGRTGRTTAWTGPA